MKFSDHGIGDYWEDIDQYIFNYGSEIQRVPEDCNYICTLAAEDLNDATNVQLAKNFCGYTR